MALVCPECGASYSEGEFCPVDGSRLTDGAADTLLGSQVGNYRIARVLGAGGMGKVYLGTNPAIGSRVAIKVLSSERSGGVDLVERFFNEARAVNLIRHENIVNIVDLARLPDGRPYIVMEFLEGAPLSRVFARSSTSTPPSLPLSRLARLMIQTLEALAAAHARGIIHRDLKPENIYVTRGGHAKVLDFGIAKLSSDLKVSGPTVSGVMLGTPPYMSPEQIKGGAIDARSDLYAAGVILFEGATGQLPFLAESLYVLCSMHVEQPPPPPRSLRADLPPVLEQVILRALAKAPEHRFADAAAMAAALEQVQRTLPVDAARDRWATTNLFHSEINIAPSAALLSPTPFSPTPGPSPHAATGPRTPVVARPPGHTVPDAYAQTQHSDAFAKTHHSDAYAATHWSSSSAPVLPAANATPMQMQPQATPMQMQPQATPMQPQATPRPRRPKKRALPWLWLAVGLLVVSGGVTAAVVVLRVNGDDDAAVAGGGGGGGGGGNRVTRKGGVTRIETGKTRLTVAMKQDPKRFDALAFYPRALALARKVMSDAILIDLSVHGVYPSGLADLTIKSGYEASYSFRSPSRSKRPAGLPANVKREDIRCLVDVDVSATKVEVVTKTSNEDCAEKPRVMWRCSMREAWQLARKQGAPKANNIVARVSWLWDGWYFDFGASSMTVHDTCGGAARIRKARAAGAAKGIGADDGDYNTPSF
ncbi:MAG: protein kinase [Myxococcales bacterium]|nr:protein kinase [Myxococcales bacterium]